MPTHGAVYLSHPSSLEHDMGPHPECPQRIVAIERELQARGWLGMQRLSSPPVSRELLERVHPPAYVRALERLAGAGGGRIDADTAMSAGSFDAALHAAGGAVELVARLLDERARTGFSAHRPPGHHAEAARAMGFCLFNNVALAARYALDEGGVQRVMIIDWDVHHGNGTNDIFHASERVLFLSIHQSPLYPGTGPAADIGSGAGQGYTVNLPVPPGSGDEEFCSLVANIALPLARAYAPGLLLVSAGYDAHRADPLASCTVTEAGYEAMTRMVLEVGAEVGAPVGMVLEGGYDLGALASSVAVSCRALAQWAAEDTPGAGGAGGAPAAQTFALTPLAQRARERVRRHWPGLGEG